MSPGDVIDSRYRVDRELGSGGMGFVLACTDLRLNRAVALKLLHGEALTNHVHLARFEREARAAAMLKSEHVVRTLDVGKLPNDAPYIVMERLDGQDLEELAKTEPLPCAVAVDYVLQACAGIAEAHANGIVHRDLKPQNLFLAKRSLGAPIVKVLDFGIAKLESDGADLTRTRDIFGTPLYMAPEQLRGAKEVDARADLWAIGAILYRLVTGHPPFDGDTMAMLCANILQSEPVPVRQLRPDAPDTVVRAVDRCLRKDPAMRFPSVAELARVLDPDEAFQQTAPLKVEPAAPPPAPPRAPSKRPWLWSLLLVPVGAGAYVVWPRSPAPAPIVEAPRSAELAPEEPPAVVAPAVSASKSAAPLPRRPAHRRPRPSTPAAPVEQDDSLPDMRK